MLKLEKRTKVEENGVERVEYEKGTKRAVSVRKGR